jgi:hypothetical protein
MSEATIGELIGLTALIAIGFLLAVAFYESMSTRDVLVARATRWGRRVSSGRRSKGIAYVLAVAVATPLLVVTWTVVLETALFAVGSVDLIGSVALVSVSIVAATRTLAYVREKTAHELAKAVPLAFAFLLLTGGSLRLEEKVARAVDRRDGTSLTVELLGFLVALELALRIATDGSHAALAGLRRRRGVADDVGFWRILWLALRGRLPPVAAGG